LQHDEMTGRKTDQRMTSGEQRASLSLLRLRSGRSTLAEALARSWQSGPRIAKRLSLAGPATLGPPVVPSVGRGRARFLRFTPAAAPSRSCQALTARHVRQDLPRAAKSRQVSAKASPRHSPRLGICERWLGGPHRPSSVPWPRGHTLCPLMRQVRSPSLAVSCSGLPSVPCPNRAISGSFLAELRG
jgi:hypothetical protein